MDIQPDILVFERALLLLSLDLLAIGIFIAFLTSDLCDTLWANTNIVIKLMFAAGIAVTYLYVLFPHMENFVHWVNDAYWIHETPPALTKPLHPQP